MVWSVRGCDLNKGGWWAAYTRQSSKEQAENDRLGEYLLTCAKITKQIGGIVPREVIIYDDKTVCGQRKWDNVGL